MMKSRSFFLRPYGMYLLISGILSCICLPASRALAGGTPPGLFVENKGQVRDQDYRPRPDVLYSGASDGLVWHIAATGIHYQLLQEVVSAAPAVEPDVILLGGSKSAFSNGFSLYRVDVQWVEANPHPVVIPAGPSTAVRHYYNVPEGTPPALGVRSWESVIVTDIRFMPRLQPRLSNNTGISLMDARSIKPNMHWLFNRSTRYE